MSSTNDLHHLAAAYALDAVGEAEREAFEAHAPDCEICRRELVEFRETAAILAEAVGTEPPAVLRAQIANGVARTPQLPMVSPDRIVNLADRRRPTTGLAVLAGAAAAVLAVVSTVALLRSLRASSEVGELLAAPDAVITTLDGSDATLRVVWSAERSRLAIVGADLADPGPDRTYELWFVLPSGEVAPAGLFGPDGSGEVTTVVPVDGPTEFTGFGVTIEPAGGSPQPTSDIVFLGSL